MWIQFIALKAKIMALTPLERYILDNYNLNNEPSPYKTYLYFLAYEDLVLKELRAGTSYQSIRKAILNEDGNACENTTAKTMIYSIGLVGVLLMSLAASSVSTGSLMALVGDLGAYGYLFQTACYAAATWAQWMIFRKRVPEVLAKLFYISRSDGWHYVKPRDLVIENEVLVNKSSIQTLSASQKWTLALFTICTGLLTISMGMIVLEKGPIFEGMHMSNLFVDTIFQGNFSAFLTTLCIVYVFCHFALYISAVIESLYKNKLWTIMGDIKNSGKPMLMLMCVLSIFGLMNSMSAQSKSTFNFADSEWGWGTQVLDFNFNVMASNEVIAIFAAFTVITAFGRVVFNLKAMQNLYYLFLHGVPDIWKNVCKDYEEYKTHYHVGVGIALSIITIFAGIELLGNPAQQLWSTGDVMPAQLATPLGLTVILALTAWGAFKAYTGYQQRKDGKDIEVESLIPKSILTERAEIRSGQQLCAVLSNAATYSAVSLSGMEVMISLYGHALGLGKGNAEFNMFLCTMAAIAGGLMSMASAMNSAEVDIAKVKSKITVNQ